MLRRVTLVAGALTVLALLVAAIWIPTVTHRVVVQGCYTEFGLLHGGGLPRCSHAASEVPSYPGGQRDLGYAALVAALATVVVWATVARQGHPGRHTGEGDGRPG